MTNNEVIIALDFQDKRQVNQFLEPFGDRHLWVKVGMELFYQEGPGLIAELKEKNYSIFLDLKLHDIPTTVQKAMNRLAGLGVDMVNVHAAGGKKMMEAAVEGLESGIAKGQKRPFCIAVTQLTSTSQEMLQKELFISKAMNDVVAEYAFLAKESKMDGVVCSPLEAGLIKEKCGSAFLTVTPGIRMEGDEKNDQKRTATPSEARKLGSDFIVVGRSITHSHNPVKSYETIVSEWRKPE